LFRSLEPTGVPVAPRWFVNNVIAIDGEFDNRPLSFVPADHYLAVKQADGGPVLLSDGNAWIRADSVPGPLFRCLSLSETRCSVRDFSDLDAVRSKGFERHSRIATIPAFVRINSLRATSAADDLRPGATSPARGIAIELP